ncbi:MAG TPA: GNAT family N-acetyltransferase [Alphaproteobacteria bacterium]|nr:GNAT family N-acetyltransferase [Alphaproteobacteria bacterium]
MKESHSIPGLRRAGAEDAGPVTSLVRTAYGKYVARIGREPKPMTVDYSHRIAAHQFWLVEEKGAIIAVLELIPEPDHLLVENIAVDPSRQSSGLGRMLMAFAEEETRRQAYRELRLYTNDHFTENIALYERIGFRETHREPYKGSQTVYMSKPVR